MGWGGRGDGAFWGSKKEGDGGVTLSGCIKEISGGRAVEEGSWLFLRRMWHGGFTIYYDSLDVASRALERESDLHIDGSAMEGRSGRGRTGRDFGGA